MFIIMQVTTLYQLRVANTVFIHRWRYKLQNFSKTLLLAPKPISYLSVYSMKRITVASSQDLALLGFFPYALIIFPTIIDHWSMLIFFFYLYDKALILKCFLILSNTNTKIWSKNEYGPLGNIDKKLLSCKGDLRVWVNPLKKENPWRKSFLENVGWGSKKL